MAGTGWDGTRGTNPTMVTSPASEELGGNIKSPCCDGT